MTKVHFSSMFKMILRTIERKNKKKKEIHITYLESCKCKLQWLFGTKVWSASSDAASNQLHAFDGATGRQLWASAALGTVARFHAPIMAKGKVYIASSSGLHAFYIGGHTAWLKAF